MLWKPRGMKGKLCEKQAKAPAGLCRGPSCSTSFGHKVAGLTSEMVTQARVGTCPGLKLFKWNPSSFCQRALQTWTVSQLSGNQNLKFKRIWTLTQFPSPASGRKLMSQCVPVPGSFHTYIALPRPAGQQAWPFTSTSC